VIRSLNRTFARIRRRNVIAPSTKRPAFEQLEDRRLMSLALMTPGQPIISEFMAINDTGLQDADGDRSDWIELHNPTPSDVNLDGYVLTDGLDRWRIPAVTLPSGGYLVIFASNKDRAVAGAELHTNFNLDGGAGEYLGLEAPNGTVVSDFGTAFPPQAGDISYGVTVTQTTTPLIRPRATARAIVPANGNLANTWTAYNFNDASWTSGTTGVGFETDPPAPAIPGFRVRMVDVGGGTDGEISHIGEATAILNGTAGAGLFTIASDTNANRSVVDFGGGGWFGGDQNFPDGTGPGTPDDSPNRTDYALRATARVTIPAGQWTVNVTSDDGFRLRIPGVTFLSRSGEEFSGATNPSPADTLVFGAPRGPAHTFATFTVPAGGIQADMQLDFYERGGGDMVELSIASGHQLAFNPAVFSALADGVLGWGVSDANSVGPLDYRPHIGLDLRTPMHNLNGSAYIRVPFSVANANDFDTLRLQMKYDDGFVAYLNGVEVARRNAPDILAFDSNASANRPDADALIYESISVNAAGRLRTGSNVLAIQGLNVTDNSSDFLIYPELQGFRTTVGTEAGFLARPTPGAVNSTTSAQGVVRDTKFSVDRGFYDAPITVAITTETEGAQIRYTTDGTAPTATTGLVYTGPITINRTTTLRAAAYKANFLSSNVDTQTYIFLDDVIRQSETVAPGPGWPAANTRVNNQIINYGMDQSVVNANLGTIKNDLKAIPTFSLVMNVNDLFNPSTGIYVNPGGDGEPWERPGSVELIYPDGTDGFQIDAGVRLRGGFSRSGDNPKHAFRLFFGADYDGDLRFPMFGPDGANRYDGFDLRTFQNYSWSFGGDGNGTFMRDQVNRDLQLAMGSDTERGDYYHLYINGQYWGLYNAVERPEANHQKNYRGGEAEDYDVIKVDPDLGYNIEATDGNMDAWNQLYQLLQGTVTDTTYELIQGNNPDGTPNPNAPVLLDVDNLIDYMLVIYYGGNLDAPISNFLGNNSPNNFFAARNRDAAAREGFRFYVHDAEHTFLPWDAGNNRLGPSPGTGWVAGSNGVNKSNPQYFFQQLWSNANFKLRVADHVQKHMVNAGGTLTAARVRALHDVREAEIDRAVVGESARWGNSKRSPAFTRSTWQGAVSAVEGWIAGRTGTVLNQLRQWNLYPSFNGPVFFVNGVAQQGGQVGAGSNLTLGNGSNTPAGSTIYYTLDGSDPRRRNGTVSPTATAYSAPIPINGTVTIRARTLSPTGVWSALNEAVFTLGVQSLKITEVMYNPALPEPGSPFTRDQFEFLEIMNTGPVSLDVSGARLRGGVEFDFPALFSMGPGERVVVVANTDAFRSRYGNAIRIAGQFANGTNLADGGEALRVESATGAVTLNFTYDDDWYPQTDGEGYSLSVINPTAAAAAYGLKSNWRPSNPLHGTPGAAEPPPPPGSVVINEVLANPIAGGSDFVELFNTTGAAVDVSGWFISDTADNLKRFRIPNGTTLPANGYLVFDGATLGFDVSAVGGTIFLSNGDVASNLGGYRESARFNATEAGTSFGQHVKSTGGTDLAPMSPPTPGAANGRPFVGPVVINELMYQPGSGKMEYIELRNVTGSDVALDGWRFADGIDYTFPAGSRIPALGYALVVAGDPAIFRGEYDVPPGVPIFGNYQRPDGTNVLNNDGENLLLLRPLVGGEALADRINYGATAPWPTDALGSGKSIAREVSADYGNDVANWSSEVFGGTPGRKNHDEDAPVMDIVDVSPDPRTTPVDSIRVVFSEPVRGVDLSDFSLTRGGGNLLGGGQTLTSDDNITWTLAGLSSVTNTPGTYTLSFSDGGEAVLDWAGNWLLTGANESWRVGAAPTGRVVARHVFYNGSAFDGRNGAANGADDGAIATDKVALLPGQTATFANYTSYSKGINGVMIDVAGLLADMQAADFVLTVGTSDDVASWGAAPVPASISRRPGAGLNGSDRVTLTWADGAIRGKWLRVQVLPGDRTGIGTGDVFYFGNLVGETGNSTSSASVTPVDLGRVRAAMSPLPAALASAYDFNRDGRVNVLDLSLARTAMKNGSLPLLSAPTVASVAGGTTSSSSSQSVFGTAPISGTSAGTAGGASSLLDEQSDPLA